MNLLSVQDYDAAERAALISVPNRIVECCQPEAFLFSSYPIRIASENAAVRYADVMQEGRAEDTYSTYLSAITTEELDLLQACAEKVAALTDEVHGKRLVPRSALLRSLNVVRHIRYLCPKLDAAIFEIGPGSGYVGALLVLLGYRYACTDITQAFYIWQNHLLNWTAGGSVAELVTEEADFFQAWGSAQVVHVPWWKYLRLDPKISTRVNIVTCNHALCEMHPNALRYALRTGREMLADGDCSCFLFEGWGSTARAPIWHAGRALAEAGFVFAHNDVKISAAVRNDSALASAAMRLPHEHTEDKRDEARFHPHIHVTENNRLGRLIAAGQGATRKIAIHTLNDVDEMLRRILGFEDLSTDDERFMRFVADRR